MESRLAVQQLEEEGESTYQRRFASDDLTSPCSIQFAPQQLDFPSSQYSSLHTSCRPPTHLCPRLLLAAAEAHAPEAGEVLDAASTPSESAKTAAAQEALLLLTIDHLQHYWAADGRWEVRGGKGYEGEGGGGQ